MRLSYEGSVKRFREALERMRSAVSLGGTLGGDELNRKRLQKHLYDAEIASRRDALLGGDTA